MSTDNSGAALTDRMRKYLERAASCERGRGIYVYPEDRRIASQAVGRGFGMTIGVTGFAVFVISDAGRAMLKARSAHHD